MNKGFSNLKFRLVNKRCGSINCSESDTSILINFWFSLYDY